MTGKNQSTGKIRGVNVSKFTYRESKYHERMIRWYYHALRHDPWRLNFKNCCEILDLDEEEARRMIQALNKQGLIMTSPVTIWGDTIYLLTQKGEELRKTYFNGHKCDDGVIYRAYTGDEDEPDHSQLSTEDLKMIPTEESIRNYIGERIILLISYDKIVIECTEQSCIGLWEQWSDFKEFLRGYGYRKRARILIVPPKCGFPAYYERRSVMVFRRGEKEDSPVLNKIRSKKFKATMIRR